MPDNICSNCVQSHKDCTYVEESRPRGPPKAYITSLEDKVERMEALLKMLGPDIDLDAELGPPIIRDSWKTDHPKTVPTSSKLTIVPPEPSLKLQNEQSRSFSHSASSSVVITTPPSASPNHKCSPSTGSVGSWSDSDESDGDSNPTNTDTRRLTMNSMEPTTVRNMSMESPLLFVGKSSSYGLSCRVRKMKAGYMDEASRAGAEREMGGEDSNYISEYSRPHRRPEFWTIPSWELAWEGAGSPPHLPGLIARLPPTDLALKLIDLFFENINIHFPLLHRPTFERQWAKGLQFRDPWFSCLCLSVFAGSSRWCNDTRVLPDEHSGGAAGDVPEERNWRQAGVKYFEACIPMCDVRSPATTPACLSEVQAHAAQSIFLRGTTDDALAWLTVSVGLRKAQDRGAHRKKVYGNTLTIDEEQWKRAVWILIVFDRLGSTHLGRPCCARETDFDLDLPVEVDDEYWENNNVTLAFQQPPGKPALVASFNSFIKLSQIMAFALITLYAVDKSKLRIGVPRGFKWKEEVVMHLNTVMTEWVDSVPEHLRWSPGLPNEIFSTQASTLYTTYYLVQLLIYRPFIPFPAISNDPSRPRVSPIAYPDFPFPAQAICVNAAKSCARIVDAQMKRGFFNIPNLIAVSHISAAMLLTTVWDLKAKERASQTSLSEDIKPQYIQMIQTLLEDVALFMKALEYTEMRWESAHLSLQNLRESLPSAVGESMPLRPMHVLDPVYPQLPVDFDWGTVPQDQVDSDLQPPPSLGPSDFPQRVPTSQMPAALPTPYPQIDQQQSYIDVTNLSQWTNQSNDSTADSTHISFALPDDWSSQPPPRSGHSDTPMDMRWSMPWQPVIPDSSYWNIHPRDGSRYEPKGLSYIGDGIMRGIYTKI